MNGPFIFPAHTHLEDEAGVCRNLRQLLVWCCERGGCKAAWLLGTAAEPWTHRDHFDDQDPLPEALEESLARWAASQELKGGMVVAAEEPECPGLANHCQRRNITHLQWLSLPVWAPGPSWLLLGWDGRPAEQPWPGLESCTRDMAHLLWLDRAREATTRAEGECRMVKEQAAALGMELARTRQQSDREGEVARRRVDEAESAKNEFLASVSHELRTPLNAIQGYTRIVLREAQLTDRQRLSLERVMTSSQNQLRLINNVLDYSRLEAGRMRLELEQLDLVQVLKDVLSQVEALAQERGLHVSMEVFPPMDRLPTVSDRAKLEQVLVNLMGNAIKFTSRGHIILRLRSEGGTAHLEVEDTGIGIPPEEQARVFERFRRTRSADASRTVSGTGLGLAISQGLAQLLGGQIRLQSEEGQGSTFTVSLPLFLDLETAALTLVGTDEAEA
jgi:signal transduction histidine kinase